MHHRQAGASLLVLDVVRLGVVESVRWRHDVALSAENFVFGVE